ncbi:MAG TPA: N-acetyltransferase [Acidobacterium sp.]|uniref:Acetyltransferase, GNAT family n=2 Tax=Acidobacteriaceae TaxID=204434 RepID=C1F6B8_ACIC5|nr:acetyltransferase, GNAT family [Acidobacterium capsulatum ATCC 51196]HCT60709.1 N-acetyltransferase [Acidobacterium sp.]
MQQSDSPDIGSDTFSLHGRHVWLEPLTLDHVPGLLAAAAADPALYAMTVVPQTHAGMTEYVQTALAWREAGTAFPFAVLRADSEEVIGSTRFYQLEHWAWPPGHPLHGRATPDACEIGYTWYAPSAVRTAVNTEAKKLLLTHAFEHWQVLRVCLHTDVRNERSRRAMERMGAKLEGILRAHKIGSDLTVRDSARYSITAGEWPAVKAHLEALEQRYL